MRGKEPVFGRLAVVTSLRRAGVVIGSAALFAFAAVAAAAAENVFSVSPYVQHPTADGMTVLFFTTKSCEATVKCWPVADAATVRAAAATCEEAKNLGKNASDDEPVWGTQYKHRARFDGLIAGTRYCYAVEPVGYAAYTNFFSTVPDRNTPVRFVAYSDSECIPPDYNDTTGNNHATSDGRTEEWDVLVNGANQTKTYYVSRSEGFASNLWHMAAWKPDLFVIAGDLAARGGVQMFWDEFWKENAGANAKGYADWAGAVPILATIGNHDLYDNTNAKGLSYKTDKGGRTALNKFLSYFEFPTNGDATYDQQYFRQDYGPVTLIFLDTNNGTTGSVSPDFKSGSTMYKWLETNLADAQKNARFTFVVQHHCPYSRGKHNKSSDGQTAVPIRNALSGLMTRYGVTAWIGGHEEVVEHATLTGTETLPDGTTAPHTVHVFDLGSGGDGLKGAPKVDCENVDFRAYDTADGTHYGHLRVEVRKNAVTRKWECVMSQVYDYLSSATGPFELRKYNEYVVESAAAPDEPEFRVEEPRYTVATRIRWSGGVKTDEQYRGFLTQKGCEYAWGRDGEAKTEWVKGDGTPLELERPDEEDGWELLVRE